MTLDRLLGLSARRTRERHRANVIEELLPQALHNKVKHANNRVECDHGRLKARLWPMRGLKTDRTATVIIKGHAFIQNLCRGLYEFGVEARQDRVRCAAAFDELASMI
jgi:transposase-like protein